ncbi:hypothetical protein IX51_02945 [uncultured archaeon]|nr:hypothetical protein IX51_02945 [uncultured archaeon]
MRGYGLTGRLKGKVSVIAGGSSGIGRAIALEYAKEGARVVIGDIREEPSEGGLPTENEIRRINGRALFVRADVSKEESVKELARSAVREYGGIDVLVNSAGIPMKKSLAETTAEDFDTMHGVTVRGAFLAAKHCMPYLLKSGNPKIINIASNFSFTALPGMSAYASAKAAVIGLTKSLALEFGQQGVNVNAICPGATKTEMSRPFWGTDEGLDLLRARTPLRKGERFIAYPDDVAKLAVFLASEDSDMITGESILIDSGWNVP